MKTYRTCLQNMSLNYFIKGILINLPSICTVLQVGLNARFVSPNPLAKTTLYLISQ